MPHVEALGSSGIPGVQWSNWLNGVLCIKTWSCQVPGWTGSAFPSSPAPHRPGQHHSAWEDGKGATVDWKREVGVTWAKIHKDSLIGARHPPQENTTGFCSSDFRPVCFENCPCRSHSSFVVTQAVRLPTWAQTDQKLSRFPEHT